MAHPYYTLNISETSSDDEIRRAYIQKICQFPPESKPTEFQQIVEAYETIKTDEDRAKLRIFGKLYHHRPLDEMVPAFTRKRHRIGVDEWLKFMKRSNNEQQ